MDLRQYFRKLREIEQSLIEEYPIVISLETADGGKAGRAIEVSRAVAAKMILDGRAILASVEEQEAHRAAEGVARLAAQRAELARRVQLAIVTDEELTAASLAKKK